MEATHYLFWITITALGIVAIVAVMVFKYFLKINRENIVLGQHDKEQSQRITTLEKKNGNEQHQIDELKKIVKEQGERIEQLERLIIRKDGQIEGLKIALQK